VIHPLSERQKNNKKPDFPTNTFPSRLPFLRKGLGIGIYFKHFVIPTLFYHSFEKVLQAQKLKLETTPIY
jgi:hypothetical protein